VSAASYKSLPYKPIDDFTIIGQSIEFPFLIVTYAGHPIRTVADIIKTAKSRTEPLLCGVPGAGTPQHLLMEYFMRLAGIKVQIVPFRGGNQALTDLMGKRIDFLLDPPIALIGQVKNGTLHAIGVTGGKRYAPLADVGTIAEAGFPGFSVTSWMGLVGPAKLPPEIVKRLNGDINALIAEPEMIEKIHKVGSEPKGGTPDEFKALIERDIARWTKVVADAGIPKIGG
jgi:tripartite-type tricarboxylate transporter receptor subunit TctC